MADRDDILAQYAGPSLTTADVIRAMPYEGDPLDLKAQMRDRAMRGQKMSPEMTARIAPDPKREANLPWLRRALDAANEFSPAAMFAANFVGPKVNVPKLRVPAAAPTRELDALGFYSQALEAAKALQRKQGAGAGFLNDLRKAGVKKNEIAATGVDKWLAENPSVTRDELVQYLRDNRVQFNESRYGPAQYEVIRSEDGAVMDGPFVSEREANSARSRYRSGRDDMFVEANYPEGVKGDPRWPEWSLDPSNPSYRESVLHLPVKDRGWRAVEHPNEAGKWALMDAEGRYHMMPNSDRVGPFHTRAAAEDSLDLTRVYNDKYGDHTFRTGHYGEINPMAHLRTSMHKDIDRRPVYLVDELQSDWGQKLREGGARDEAKIAALRASMDAAYEPLKALKEQYHDLKSHELGQAKALSQKIDEAYKPYNLAKAELETATAAAPDHPLVSSTDQWTTTAIRRLMQQAHESGAEGIALTPGQLQIDRYPGLTEAQQSGMRKAYDEMYPKMIEARMREVDQSYPGRRSTLLRTADSWEPSTPQQKSWAADNPSVHQDAFHYFPLTKPVKDAIAKGLPMFTGAGAVTTAEILRSFYGDEQP